MIYTIVLIFALCVILFVADIFPPATVAMGGCVAMILFGVCSPAEAMEGFTSDIVLIVFGTEVFGIAFHESGLSALTAHAVIRLSGGQKGGSERRVILAAGLIAAALSAFLNNQVVCALMMVICTHIASEMERVHVKNITLPVILCAVLGGQCTLIGAPATLVASSMAEESLGVGLSMFELLPMGLILLGAGLLFMLFVSYRQGLAVWGGAFGDCGAACESDVSSGDVSTAHTLHRVERRGVVVTVLAGIVMVTLFVTGWTTVGTASVLGALICLFGGAVEQRRALARVDWNILIWLSCSVSLAGALNRSGAVQSICAWVIGRMQADVSPVLVLTGFVLATVLISNLIANTTAVIMVLPFALQIAAAFSWNGKTFLIAVVMAAGLSILTPLSSGFIGMTMRAGYRFRDYIRYGWSLQLLLAALLILLTVLFYPL